VAADGVRGLEAARAAAYDAAVVDVCCRVSTDSASWPRCGAPKSATPVLFLSARHTVDDRVKGLQSGGDDYLTKPFAFSELLARLQAITRRGHLSAEPQS
jgi:two-component system OmpR family response regulator